MESALIESVPNFSEGRNLAVVQAIAEALGSVPGANLLHADSGYDANRTVYTLAGRPDPVAEALLRGARRAFELIDMSRHSGAHPRIGALDVLPIVPVAGTAMEEARRIAADLASRIARELDVPIYLYARSARDESRRELSSIRRGGYEGLEDRLRDDAWIPDFGPRRFVPGWGATVCGARDFLIAWNINLSTQDEASAKAIASSLRAAGPDGRRRFPGLKALGWYMEEYGCAQVSCNVYDFRASPLQAIYGAAAEMAAALGCRVRGSELIGLAPLEAVMSAGRAFTGSADRGAIVEAAVRGLGLDALKPFEPEKRILELAMAKEGMGSA